MVSPGLHGIEPVNICGGMFHNERHTSTSHCSRLPSPPTILCHQRASERRSIGIDGSCFLGNNGEAMAVLEYAAVTLMSGTVRSLRGRWRGQGRVAIHTARPGPDLLFKDTSSYVAFLSPISEHSKRFTPQPLANLDSNLFDPTFPGAHLLLNR